MGSFKLVADFQPQGDQPQAIESLTRAFRDKERYQTLMGVTGSGKTFTMAHVVQNLNRPTLVISHNKTLAAQLYGEFKGLFPENAVEYFISYYDYYQPEAYIPSSDTYIEKDTHINDEIDRLRLKATSSLLSRRDVLIVASVSCIYGLGSPKDFYEMLLFLEKGASLPRREITSKLVDIHYTRNDLDFHRGTFRVRGDVLEIFPAYEQQAIRVELWGDQIEEISRVDPLTGEVLAQLETAAIYPAKHFVTTVPKMERAIERIREELAESVSRFRSQEKFLEAQRIGSRTTYDIEMMQEIGYCSGIENYSRHIAGREAGERPACLIDYFPDDFFLIIDESHATIPQIRAMFNGDRARKETLVQHGFRLPSALDNRPLRFEEFETVTGQTLFVSATPADYELEKCGGVVVEQIIRPTGLIDPEVLVKPVRGQIDDLIERIKERVASKERVLVTTLTKRMAEDLTDYLADLDIRVRYLHSEIDALDRVEILRGLRLAEFDVLVGINLLREGLDLPEVSLVAILDADKQGFLRSERSLMQTAGRAARNIRGAVILYADSVTPAMKNLIEETKRRRALQMDYNIKHNITPRTIYKSTEEVMMATAVADSKTETEISPERFATLSAGEREEVIDMLTREMNLAAEKLDFERAAQLRDEIETLRDRRGRKKSPVRYARRKR